jgi:hypothetical protein
MIGWEVKKEIEPPGLMGKTCFDKKSLIWKRQTGPTLSLPIQSDKAFYSPSLYEFLR